MARMTTTCPDCGTAFHVQPAQLQARQGLVRCGRCARVFNAFESLATREAELPEPPAGPPQAEEELPAVFRRAGHGAAAAPGAAESANESAAAEAGGPAEQVPELSAAGPPLTALSAGAGEASPPQALVAPPGPEVAVPVPEAAGPPPPRPKITIPLPEPEEFAPEPRRLGWLWGLLSLLLLGLLAGQAAYQFRSDIAVLYPPARPWLEQLCQPLECSVPLPRRPDYLDIAGSDLRAAERDPRRIAFEATLRNRAPYPLEHPALELTLTDARDQAVARRVFLPAEYLPGTGRGAAEGMAAGSELTLRLDLDIGDIRATGYRVYLFYP